MKIGQTETDRRARGRFIRRVRMALAAAVILASGPTLAIENASWFGPICRAWDTGSTSEATRVVEPTVRCKPAPQGFQDLTDGPAPHGRDVEVTMYVGADPTGQHLCFARADGSPAPVIRVERGHRLTITVVNTLHDGPPTYDRNCLVDTFVGGGPCRNDGMPAVSLPGRDGTFYPIAAWLPHVADGTVNLHVHGLVVSPRPCHDEVLRSTIQPADWRGAVAFLPCQTAPNRLTYSYDIPADHPTGLFWFHGHRHGQAQADTALGLVGAIVVEGREDAVRRASGVEDHVLIVGDYPLSRAPLPPAESAADGSSGTAARAGAQAMPEAGVRTEVRTDPRIDRANEISCDAAATDEGGAQITRLTLNGALVAERADSTLALTRAMAPGSRSILRLLNASANTYIRPQLSTFGHGGTTPVPFLIVARDGVPVVDRGVRRPVALDWTRDELLLPPGSRLEILVTMPAAGDALLLNSGQVRPGCAGDGDPGRQLMRLVSVGAPRVARDAAPAIAGTGVEPDMAFDAGERPANTRTFAFTEYPRGFTVAQAVWPGGKPGPSAYDPSKTDFFLTQIAASDGQAAMPRLVPFSMHSGRPDVVIHLNGRDSITEDWTLQNYTLEVHAFHIHQMHFRDITQDAEDVDRSWILDVLNVPAAQNVSGLPGAPGERRIRVRFTRAMIGEFVYHCHVLEHEDNGMMAKIRVVAD